MTEIEKRYYLSSLKRIKEKIGRLDAMEITIRQLLTAWEFDKLNMRPIEEMHWDLSKAIEKGDAVIDECYLPENIRRNTGKPNAKFIRPK